MTLTLTILGCGSSGGVPRVGQGWGACDPANPRNRRRRCALLVEQTGPGGVTSVLVDTGPDLREQLLDAGVTRLDGVIYTHDHADHTHGIDDLRPLALNMRRRVEAYADEATYATLMARFGYCFASPAGSDYPPIINLNPLVAHQPLAIEGPGGAIVAVPFPVMHGAPYKALGFRFNNTVYCPDINILSDESSRYFEACELIMLDALRFTRHPTHLSVDEALALIERFKPARTILTNLHSDLDYQTLAARLPTGIVPAHDGMTVTVE
ncbi:MBL fold metallo-hydrolase [Phreatobacter stygius]|uniref:MBL fold metallo-hydrolase n=1 Tax=Phreatobacter stygius TaxID=1940610 RepID=A0A4D7BGL8_9HYPH|nr:MBL fold metallo-hydrolase [Phreatobacter stygius]QCI68306.1 MBL fold metallo-hydrolase [Phreatobacter stygius]